MDSISHKSSPLLVIAVIGLVMASVSAAGAVFSAIGTRLDFWDFRTGFFILRFSAYGGLSGAILSLAGVALNLIKGTAPGVVASLVGLAVGAVTVWVPLGWLMAARTVPPIHDITTYFEDPPGFVAILKVRNVPPSSREYGGEEVASQQRAAYPDIGPLQLPVSVDRAFEAALSAARDMGWEIVDFNLKDGRIEAVDTTFWFGFKDDIVVRLRESNGGTRVDARSVSRVGRSDIGTNARRIREYLGRLKGKAATQSL